MTDRTRIDGQKLDMHPHRLVQLMDGKDNWDTASVIAPIYVEVSPIGVCNHECTFCSVDYVLDRTDAPRVTYDVLARTFEDMAKHGVKSVMFAGAGEPFLYKDPATKKDLSDLILAADNVGIDTAVTTNAVLLTPERAERAFAAKGLRWIRTSINAGDRETYAKIHRTKPEDFDRVLANLEAAVKIRDRMGAKTQLLGQIVVVPAAKGVKDRRHLTLVEEFPANAHTVVTLAKRLRDIGVDNLGVKPFKQHVVEEAVTRSDLYKGTSYEDADTWGKIFNELEALQTDRFEVTIRRGAMSQQVATWRGYNACYSTPFLWAYLEADGQIWGCSAYLGYTDHETGKEVGDHRFRFGSVNEQSFWEIWTGDRRKACWEYTRKPPSEGGLDVSKCMLGCQMDMPNMFLWQLMHPDPTHNFIK